MQIMTEMFYSVNVNIPQEVPFDYITAIAMGLILKEKLIFVERGSCFAHLKILRDKSSRLTCIEG